MSLEAMESVLEHSQSKGSARLVLLAIASRANEHGCAWPGAEDIAARSGVSSRSVWSAIKSLVELGEVEVEAGSGRRSNTYRIKLPGLVGRFEVLEGGRSTADSAELQTRSTANLAQQAGSSTAGFAQQESRSTADSAQLEPVVLQDLHTNTDITTDRQTDLQSSERDQLELAGDGGEGLDEGIERDAAGLLKQRKKVDGKLVSPEEMQIAVAALKEFNVQSGKEFGLGAHLSMIVMRVRERPSYDAAAHERLVRSAWRIRWWERSSRRRRQPTPRVVYGNTDVFERVVQDAIEEKRGRSAEEIATESTETQRRKYERRKPIDSKVLTKEDQDAAVASLVDMAMQKSEVAG